MVLSPDRLPQVNFQDPATRVRLNPETYLKFENGDMVTLQNLSSDQTVRIKYDIMLILYPMIQWTTMGEICEGWPPEDQAKIKEHMVMLYQSKIIIVHDSETTETPASPLPLNLGNQVTINVENHHVMLRDTMRMSAYRHAIEKAVTPDSIVMDLGAGSGILSLFAAKAGAKKVHAIEKRSDMARLAVEIIKANGFAGTIDVLENSSHLVKPEELSPRPDLLVAEILANAIFEEHVLEFTLDARDRLLAPGGKMIPSGLEIVVAAFDAGPSPDREQEVTELEGIYDVDLGLLKAVLGQKPTLKLDRFSPHTYPMMSAATSVIYLDFQTMQSSRFRQSFTITPTQDGFINGFCAFFRAHLDETTILTNSPWAPPTHWTQAVFYFPDRRAVKANEPVAMEMSYDGGLMLWFKDDYPDAP